MRLLFFGTFDERRHPRAQILAEGLAELGHEILRCNAPLGIDTSERVRLLRQPWRAPALIGRLMSRWTRLWRAARSLERPDAVIVPYLGHLDVHLARRAFRQSPVALDYFISGRDTAIDRGIRSRTVLAILGRIDRAALRAASVVFVDVEGHRALVPESLRPHVVVVPVGAPRGWFRKPERSDAASLRVVFFGTFTPLQGAPVIADALARLGRDRQDLRVALVGDGQDYDLVRSATADVPRLQWHRWMEPEALRDLVAESEVCLGIFGTSAKARRVVPNKVFQGAAIGCAIVTSDTPAQRQALGEAAVFVPPGDPLALAQALAALADDRERLWHLRVAAQARAEERFRPAVIARPLSDRLEALA